MKGWNSSKHPIFTANQMPAPVKWNPMSEDWKAWLGENQVYHGTSGFSKEVLETMKKLHDHILTFGGDEVCMTTYDEDAQKFSTVVSSSMAAATCEKENRVSAIAIPLIFGMPTEVAASLQRAMLFPKMGFGALIRGSFSLCHALFAYGKPLSNASHILA